MSEKRFIVVQAATSGVWRHYLSAWVRNGTWVQDGANDPRAIPVWRTERDQALKLDDQAARQIVFQFDTRYGRREMVHHLIEELP